MLLELEKARLYPRQLQLLKVSEFCSLLPQQRCLRFQQLMELAQAWPQLLSLPGPQPVKILRLVVPTLPLPEPPQLLVPRVTPVLLL